MRAIVLLCLLHSAFGQTTRRFSWNGPGHKSEDPNTGNACGADQGSCSCCLMLQEMKRIRTNFNTSLTMLEKEYLHTKNSLAKIEASRAAFAVGLFREDRFKCFGPFSTNTIVVYNAVFLNLGDFYDVQTGIFTVPYSGVYSLALTIYSDAGSPNTKLAACAGLLINGKMMAGSSDKNYNDQEDSSSIVVALHLMAGYTVSVNLPTGCFLCDDSSHYNTFSAFLLYLTE